jgi:hypothetical protein
VPSLRPCATIGTVSPRTPPSEPRRFHHSSCAARRSSCGRFTSKRSSPPALVSTRPSGSRIAAICPSGSGCSASQRLVCAASSRGVRTRSPGPRWNDATELTSWRSSARSSRERAITSVTAATKRTQAAARSPNTSARRSESEAGRRAGATRMRGTPPHASGRGRTAGPCVTSVAVVTPLSRSDVPAAEPPAVAALRARAANRLRTRARGRRPAAPRSTSEGGRRRSPPARRRPPR